MDLWTGRRAVDSRQGVPRVPQYPREPTETLRGKRIVERCANSGQLPRGSPEFLTPRGSRQKRCAVRELWTGGRTVDSSPGSPEFHATRGGGQKRGYVMELGTSGRVVDRRPGAPRVPRYRQAPTGTWIRGGDVD